MDHLYSRTIISSKGAEYECKYVSSGVEVYMAMACGTREFVHAVGRSSELSSGWTRNSLNVTEITLIMHFLNSYFLSVSFSSFIPTPLFIRRATSGTVESSDFPEHGLVHDGTPCGENLVCVNQTCVSLFPHIDNTKCPTNQNNVECSGHGVSFQFFRFFFSSLSICVFIFFSYALYFMHTYVHTMLYDTCM